jgi:prenyltransferase beta subunit
MKRYCLVCLVCVLCLVPAWSQTPDVQAKLNSILYVQKLQTPQGGFLNEKRSDPKSLPTLRSTSTAVLALKYLGGEVPKKEAVIKYVASCFDKGTGGFADVPGGKADPIVTGVGLIAVHELGMSPETFHGPAINYLAANAKSFEEIRVGAAGLERIKAKSPSQAEWVAEMLKVQLPPLQKEPNGRARTLGGQTVTLLRLGQTPKNVEETLKDLRLGQRGDGAFGKDESPNSDLETTYRVMRAFMMLKAKPANEDALRGYIRKCRNADHGYGVAVGQPSSVSGTYFATILVRWLDEMK